jgi:hypothetical protein
MSLKILMVLTLLWAGRGLAEQSVVNMNFYEAYQACQGEVQIETKKYKEAYETYSKLAAKTSDSDLATLAKARAAVALGLQEGKYEQGLERADSVADYPFSIQSRIQLMAGNRDYKKLLEAFADEDIPAWPKRVLPKLWNFGSRDLRSLALYDRGRAHLETGNAKAAVTDIEKALEFTESEHQKSELLSFLARQVYERKLKDADKTFETDMRILELGKGKKLQSRIQAAAYLRGKQRYDEAMTVLGPGWSRSTSRHWFTRGMKAVAETLAAAGRYREAADAYRIMAEADDKRTNKADRSWAALQMARVLAEAGDTEAAGMVYTDLLARNDVSEENREQARAALAALVLSLNGDVEREKAGKAKP